ncbi:MAG: helix-turn-helix domain-containing protein [Anaerolineae bacterium]|nr:helix-turn-helix domain-containing protein [Anaerolineae bacterium]
MSSLTTILGEQRTYSGVADTHTHDYAQLIIPLQGAMHIETPRYRFDLNETRIFFLPPDCRHTFFGTTHNRFLVLDIPGRAVSNAEPSTLAGGLSLSLDARWHAFRALLLHEVGDRPTNAQPLTHLFQYAYHSLLSEAQTPRSIDYLHRHFHEPLDLATLAAIEGFNPTYFSGWFKKETGQTVTQYLHHLRLQEAKTLLMQTDLPIAHIAQQVGYEHHASLVRLFRQYEQLSPSAFRQQSRNSAK